MISIASWNVNGIRAAEKKGLFTWLEQSKPDILCLQETKAKPEILTENFISPPGYESYWSSAEKNGYSGVVVYTRKKPLSVDLLGSAEFDSEGRGLVIELKDFILINGYFPNSQEKGARLDYKLGYCGYIFDMASKIVASGGNILICGDYNIAHKPIDLANPKANEKNPGYLPEERAWMDYFTENGFTDTFRSFTSEGGHYTWWTYRFKAREKDIGWRLDYHCVNNGFSPAVKRSIILKNVMGSDHCPVWVELDAE
jgi:exodeoxyribonuclease-3